MACILYDPRAFPPGQAVRPFLGDVSLFSRDASSGGAAGHLKARLSELGVWGRMLSPAEVAAHATGGGYDYIRDSGAGLLVRTRPHPPPIQCAVQRATAVSSRSAQRFHSAESILEPPPV